MLMKENNFKGENTNSDIKEVEMARKRQESILLSYGWLFVVLGFISLFLHYVIKINLLIGGALVNTELTGFFLLIVGGLSLLLYYLSK